MALIMATWAHGNAVVAQHPAVGALQDVDGRSYTSVTGYREGSMAVYQGTGSTATQDMDTWFHIPIPTMSWLPTAGGGPSGRAFLDSFCVLFRTENCSLKGLHAWDGQNRFFSAQIPNVAHDRRMDGDWSQYGQTLEPSQTSSRMRISNLFEPRESGSRHAMLFGLGISIHVDFTIAPGGAHPRKIIFLGAGANWHDVAIG